MTYLSRHVKVRPDYFRSHGPVMSSREGSGANRDDEDKGSGRRQEERSKQSRHSSEAFQANQINTAQLRQFIMEMFNSNHKRQRAAARSQKTGEGEAPAGAAGGTRVSARDTVPARDTVSMRQGTYFAGMFGAGAAGDSALPWQRRQIPDYYNEQEESTLGKRSAASSRLWDLNYPRWKVDNEVSVFCFKDLQESVASERTHNDPWRDLAVVPGHLTRLSITSNFSRYDLTEYILGGFRTSGDADLTYMHRALDHNIYQIPWGNYLMPPLCIRCNAQWMDSFQTNYLKNDPKTMSYNDYERKKKLWLELVHKHVLATSRTNGHHFNACLYVFPKDVSKQGYIIMMDPLGSGIDELQKEFENIAHNLVVLKRTVFNDPHVRQKHGSLNPASLPPRMRFVKVTHPAHLTQGLDSGCSLWCLFQLTYWLHFFQSSCVGGTQTSSVTSWTAYFPPLLITTSTW